MPEFTPNLNLELPDFNVVTWHDQVNGNFTILDAAITALELSGLWENATLYTSGDRVIDPDSAIIYVCQVSHTSASTGTMADDRLANPTYWNEIGDIGTFLGLTDVEELTYVGQSGKVIVVNATEDGLQFANPSAPAARATREVNAAGDVTFDADNDDVVFINKTVGAATVVNLPMASDRTQGRTVTIIDAKLDSDVNPITVTPDGVETIIGLSSWIIDSQGGYVNLIPHPDTGKWCLC